MKIALFIFCCLPAGMSAQKQLLVNGKIEGLKDQSMVFITDANTPTDTFARAIVKKGHLN
jgi:hypothetical protein